MAQVGMLNEHRKILRENYLTIANEMQADRVLQSMKDIFTAFDEEEIRTERTESKRAEKMLDMLPRKGENAFPKFLVALWQIQPWLAKHLAQLAGIEVSELSQSTLHNDCNFKFISVVCVYYHTVHAKSLNVW